MVTPNATVRFTPQDLEALGVIQSALGLDRTSVLRMLIHRERLAIDVARAKAAGVSVKKQRPGA
jgi:hypothetical protein